MQQSSKRAPHQSGWLGFHMGLGILEDSFEVAQAVGHLVQQNACSRYFFKGEIAGFMKGSRGAFLAEAGAPAA